MQEKRQAFDQGYSAVPALFHEPLSVQVIIAVYLQSLAFQLAVAAVERGALE